MIIHILVNNAGFSLSKKFLEYKITDWQKTLDINLTTPFLLTQIISKNFMNSGQHN